MSRAGGEPDDEVEKNKVFSRRGVTDSRAWLLTTAPGNACGGQWAEKVATRSDSPAAQLMEAQTQRQKGQGHKHTDTATAHALLFSWLGYWPSSSSSDSAELICAGSVCDLRNPQELADPSPAWG